LAAALWQQKKENITGTFAWSSTQRETKPTPKPTTSAKEVPTDEEESMQAIEAAELAMLQRWLLGEAQCC
jgi:hypothetical protein